MYTFNTTLLSAEKYSNPQIIGAALSGSGVNIITLGADDIGITFNAVTPLNGQLVEITVDGSLFAIDTAYQDAEVAIIKATANNVKTFTLYTVNSAYATAPLSSYTTGVTEVIDPEARRKWVYGYI